MPAIVGIDKFKEAMASHESEYVLIGGGACSILFEEAGADFRLTKNLDIVILTDFASPSFGRALWKLVRDGGYEAGKRKEGGCAYYRFALPVDSPNTGIFPSEIELFARHPDFALEDEGSHIIPLPFDDIVSSLSAIILDDGYYEFIKESAIAIDGVSTLSALHIIPLKMRAHIDNQRLRKEGVRVSEKVLRKHRADVAELSNLLPVSARLALTDQMRADAKVFFADFERYASSETNRKRRAVLNDTFEFLKRVYL